MNEWLLNSIAIKDDVLENSYIKKILITCQCILYMYRKQNKYPLNQPQEIVSEKVEQVLPIAIYRHTHWFDIEGALKIV